MENLETKEVKVKDEGGLNPKLREFMDAHPKLTVIGLFWAGYWRLSLYVTLGYLVLVFGFAVLVGLFS